MKTFAILPLSAFCLTLNGCGPTIEDRVRQQYTPVSASTPALPLPQARFNDYVDFSNAEAQGFRILATGNGIALSLDGQTIQLQPGERLHVVSLDPDSGRILVRRERYNALAYTTRAGIEVTN